MRLHAVVLLGALLLGAGACPAAGPPASATNAVRLDAVADDGLTLALWAKAPPAPRGTILLLEVQGPAAREPLRAAGRVAWVNSQPPWRFLGLYLASGLGAAAASLLASDVVSAGASGPLFGMIGVTLALHRRALPGWRAFATSPATVQVVGQLAAWTVVAVVGKLPIDHAAHLGGLVTGAAATWALTSPGHRPRWLASLAALQGHHPAGVVGLRRAPPGLLQPAEGLRRGREVLPPEGVEGQALQVLAGEARQAGARPDRGGDRARRLARHAGHLVGAAAPAHFLTRGNSRRRHRHARTDVSLAALPDRVCEEIAGTDHHPA